MLEEDRIEIERLLECGSITIEDSQSAQRLVRTYINSGYKCCMTCPPQIRKLFAILRDWYQKQIE